MNKVVPIMMAMALTAPLSLSAMQIASANLTSANITSDAPKTNSDATVVVGSATKPKFTAHSAKDVSKAADAADSANVLLKKRLHGLQQYQAAFNQTVTDAQGNIVHEAQGTLTMMRPNKLRWETTFPDETLLIADGEAVWNIDTFVEQVTIISQDQAIKDNPIVLLTANDDETWDSFVISKLDDAKASSTLEQYQIVPKSTDGQIKSLTLGFNSDGILSTLDMLDAQDQTSALVFSKQDLDFAIDTAKDNLFSVDVPQSYIIDDQR
ncbi:outer membrane lipoprotein chaperone LolA [Alteromonas stellipolaris]|jgi:outer membrane lipoprotein carrier protein|uniref:Outer-membrane lipoprotein carrier protein n=2 Tax=Alteromonas stellipolaris TaxID=233316 RepID=A0ABM5YHI2_9ALTE|nr:outer membrane lipoprotein chaperone LolA [Alteromonas stellipolaris]ALM90634.1 outer membrane lipoprotein carrier protein LolA [Alteromonas stellipolaris LMG 21856]AMJ73697.1 outer membrane lipoprotein carrier protein LolA [Alteromonas stellipolaris]